MVDMGMVTGIKTFTATKQRDREELGDRVTTWLRNQRTIDIVDIVVTQSSDNEFHCLTITVFYGPNS